MEDVLARIKIGDQDLVWSVSDYQLLPAGYALLPTHTYRRTPSEAPKEDRPSVSSKEPYLFRLASSWNIASPLSAFDWGKYICTLMASFSTSR